MSNIKCELYHDNFQNFKGYNIPKAQLVIADIPFNLGANAYASNPMWYKNGDNKNGESDKAKKSFFNSDGYFKIAEYMHFCSRLLKPEPKEKGKAPAMIVFCAFDQMQTVIDYGKQYGFANSYPIFFVKNYSAQVLKANMKIVGAIEYAVVLYRDKLPKFNNIDPETGKNKMIFNWFEWKRDGAKEYPKIHPTQKPVNVLKRLIGIFTDEGDVVIDPVAGSGTTLRAAYEMGRSAYGFEIDRNFYQAAKEQMLAVCDGKSESTSGARATRVDRAPDTTVEEVNVKKVIAIDFDGCLCANAWPEIGHPNWDVIAAAKSEQEAGAALILWTCREDELLQNAIEAAARWGLTFDAVNDSLPEWKGAWGNNPRKIGASEYWDDHAVRMPPEPDAQTVFYNYGNGGKCIGRIDGDLTINMK